MGVRRAMRIAEELEEAGENAHVYTLGPLIHNRQVLEKLKARALAGSTVQMR